MTIRVAFCQNTSLMQSRSFQILAMQNLDRLLLKSMLGMAERHLTVRWVESMSTPSVVFADADTAEGFDALNNVKNRGAVPIALTSRQGSQWKHVLKRPLQARELLTLLNQITLLYPETSYQTPAPSALVSIERATVHAQESELLRKAGNLFDYLVRQGPRGIVETRFAPGKSVIFNHVDGTYLTSIPQAQLLSYALHSLQETAHGVAQATAEWNIAKRVLPERQIEDLAWQVVINHSHGKALPRVGNVPHGLSRLPRLSTQQMTPTQLSMAKMLMRARLDVRALARNCGAAFEEAVNVCNALSACGLLTTPDEVRTPSPLLSQAAMLLTR